MDMPASITVAGVSGSLRNGSFNTATLRAAVGLAPAGMTITPCPISDIPLYNGDVEAQGLPGPVQQFRAALFAADAILLVTPEYNYSVPGVLKNAIDWASRPPGQPQPFDGKPTAILGASPGVMGTARSQYHLRQVLVSLNAAVLSRPEVMIAAAATKFDGAGVLTDAETAKRIAVLLEALARWTERLKAVP
jgi:chromate reductase